MFLIRKSYRGMDEFKLIIIVKYDSSNGQIFNKKQMIRILMRKKSSNNWWVFENDLLFSEKKLIKEMISSNDWIESKKLNYWNIDEIELSLFRSLSSYQYMNQFNSSIFDIISKIINLLIRKLAYQNSDKLILSIFGSAQKYDQNFNHHFFEFLVGRAKS